MAKLQNIGGSNPEVNLFSWDGRVLQANAANGTSVPAGGVVQVKPGTYCDIHTSEGVLAAHVMNYAGTVSTSVHPPGGISVSSYSRYYFGSYRYDLEISDPTPPFNIGIRG